MLLYVRTNPLSYSPKQRKIYCTIWLIEVIREYTGHSLGVRFIHDESVAHLPQRRQLAAMYLYTQQPVNHCEEDPL